jgi:23S rRNA pseudouridine1911/1915/1917 synthase
MSTDAPRRFEIAVAAEDAGARLDRMLAIRLPDLSRARIQALIREGHASRGGVALKDPSAKVNASDIVALDVPPAADPLPTPQQIPLTVVYEDADLIVIDKPPGLVVHPAPGHGEGTLVNALLAHCGDSLSGIGGVKRPGIVHRLDKDTSGLLVVAKNDRAHKSLAAQFADHGRTGELRRAYQAVAWGTPARTRLTVDAAIERSPANREKMAVRKGGREAVTHVHLAERFGSEAAPVASLLRCTLETGRTHQIRVHLAHIGHPLLGDRLYGAGFRSKASQLSPEAQDALLALGCQALHAAELQFEHPTTGEVMAFSSPLPPDLQRLVEALRAMEKR